MLIDLDALDLPPGQIEVEIHYSYAPPDPITLTQRCRYEPPGASADVELSDVRAITWTIEGRTVKRSDHWVWLLLDAYAWAQVIRDWDDYRQLCIERSTLEN